MSAHTNPEEFEAGYYARLAGEDYTVGATPSWRAGWNDADNPAVQQQNRNIPALAQLGQGRWLQ